MINIKDNVFYLTNVKVIMEIIKNKTKNIYSTNNNCIIGLPNIPIILSIIIDS